MVVTCSEIMTGLSMNLKILYSLHTATKRRHATTPSSTTIAWLVHALAKRIVELAAPMDNSFTQQRCVHVSMMRWSMLSIQAAPVKKTNSTLKLRGWKRQERDHQMEIRKSAHKMSTCQRVGAMDI